MRPKDWPRLEEMFHQALQRDPAEREAYVRQACNGGSRLLREVASLLENHEEAGKRAAWAAAAAAKRAGYSLVRYSQDRTWDVAPDGNRFLVVASPDEQETGMKLQAVVNWFEGLRRRAPAGGK